MRTGIENRPTLRHAEAACACRSVATFLRSAFVRALAAPSTFTPSAGPRRRRRAMMHGAARAVHGCSGSFSTAAVAWRWCTAHTPWIYSRRACYLDSLQYSCTLTPLSHARRRLPQALAAPRLHGQMADPNSRAASAECSRSIEPASMVRVDVPAGSIVHAHGPQSDRTAHSACTALIALSSTDGWTAISTLNAQAHASFDFAKPTRTTEMGARARTNIVAAGVRLYGLAIDMAYAQCRAPLRRVAQDHTELTIPS